ncbi:MAG: hypothetical protein RMY34_20435 [Aulosira sp. DedQUE10]|nr:hypothetical protein [Aulosira sp. DedQUE10]
MTVADMPRQKKPTTTRSTRFLSEIAEALDKYADDQMLSSNAAVNKLLKERLTELGYLKTSEVQS